LRIPRSWFDGGLALSFWGVCCFSWSFTHCNFY
jgi:hypothetical protein